VGDAFVKGQRVRVSDGGHMMAHRRGEYGVVAQPVTKDDACVHVDMDDGTTFLPFFPKELVSDGPAPNVAVVKGIAYVFRDSEGNVTDVLVGGQSLHAVVENHKRYKVTVEEVST
jgi:hypothetical protein